MQWSSAYLRGQVRILDQHLLVIHAGLRVLQCGLSSERKRFHVTLLDFADSIAYHHDAGVNLKSSALVGGGGGEPGRLCTCAWRFGRGGNGGGRCIGDRGGILLTDEDGEMLGEEIWPDEISRAEAIISIGEGGDSA
jgi:hypothetical protein